MTKSPATTAVFGRTGKRAAGEASSGLCGYFRLRPSRLAVGLALAVLILGVFGQAHASSIWEGGDWGGRDFTPANGDVLLGTFTNVGRFLINAGDTILAGSGLVSLMTHDSVINGVLYGGATLAPRLELTAQEGITMNGALDRWSYISLTTGGGNITLSGSVSISALPSGSVTLHSASASGTISSGAGTLLNSSGGITIYDRPVSGTIANTGAGSLSISGGDIVLHGRPVSDAIVVPRGTLVVNTPLIVPGELMFTAVPLPSALLLFAPGLAGILYARRRLHR